MSGHFITLEGGEGSGKSTQMHYLEKKLKSLGHDVLLTREPGGSAGAEAVRHVLLSGAAEQFGSEMEALLFAAARADHVDQIVRPAIEAGKVVISDRFFDSTRVYQGASGKAGMDLLHSLEKLSCTGAWPELTIILDIDPAAGLERVTSRLQGKADPDRFEKDDLEQQNIRRTAYLEIAETEPERCAVVDAGQDEEKVAEAIWKVLGERIPELAKKAPGKTTRGRKSASRTSRAKTVPHKELTRPRKTRAKSANSKQSASRATPAKSRKSASATKDSEANTTGDRETP